MQNKEKMQEYKDMKGMRWVICRMSMPRAAQRHALPILKSWTRRQRDINKRREKQVLTSCEPRNRSIDNANQRVGARIRPRKEWGELSVECPWRGRHNAMLSQYWKHKPEDNETSTNRGSSKYLRAADQKKINEWGELIVEFRFQREEQNHALPLLKSWTTRRSRHQQTKGEASTYELRTKE